MFQAAHCRGRGCIHVQGFIESLDNKSRIEKEEVQTLLVALDATVKEKQQEKERQRALRATK